jgi:hypothetical protein
VLRGNGGFSITAQRTAPFPVGNTKFLDSMVWRGQISFFLMRTSTCEVGESEVPVAASAVAPPGPIPNPVVTRRSAGEYSGGDPRGGEAAAGTSDSQTYALIASARGGAAAARWAHNPKVGGSNPPPATNLKID